MLFTPLLLSSIIFVIEIQKITENSVILTCSGGKDSEVTWKKGSDVLKDEINKEKEVIADQGIVKGEYSCEYKDKEHDPEKDVKHMFYLNVKGEETSS